MINFSRIITAMAIGVIKPVHIANKTTPTTHEYFLYQDKVIANQMQFIVSQAIYADFMHQKMLDKINNALN